jgi:hypothetical protein
MKLRKLLIWMIFACAAQPATAGDLLLPVFALNLEGRAGDVWSSEIYLTNPGDQPVQVEIARFLPGNINKPAPCDFFMAPTRVVPPYSATIWTAAGLATDLGCAESARGGLVLRADGPVHVTSRMVNIAEVDDEHGSAVLSGRGEAFEAIASSDLPAAGSHLLPALMWHRNPCEESDFDSFIGFANPGEQPVRISLDVPHETSRSVRINGREFELPHPLTIRPGAWRQFRLSPIIDNAAPCGGIESFLVRLETDQPVAIYGSVIDRRSGDPRTVSPVPLRVDRIDAQPLDRN